MVILCVYKDCYVYVLFFSFYEDEYGTIIVVAILSASVCSPIGRLLCFEVVDSTNEAEKIVYE